VKKRERYEKNRWKNGRMGERGKHCKEMRHTLFLWGGRGEEHHLIIRFPAPQYDRCGNVCVSRVGYLME
jgi:hypothetical protein